MASGGFGLFGWCPPCLSHSRERLWCRQPSWWLLLLAWVFLPGFIGSLCTAASQQQGPNLSAPNQGVGVYNP